MASSDEEKISAENVTEESKKENTKTSSTSAMDPDDENSDSDSDLSDSDYVCSVCSKKFSGFIPFQQHEKGSKHAKALLKKKREKKLREKITVAEKVTENDNEYLDFIKEPYAVCKPCQKQFSGPESYALHVDSKVHKQKVLQASILDQVRDNGEINVDMLKEFYKSKVTADDAEDLLEEEFECKDCKKIFSGMIPYTQHVMSKVHARAVEKKKLLQKIVPEDIQHATKSEVRDVSHLIVEDDILVCKLCSTSFSGPENAIQHLKSRNHTKNLKKYLRKQEKKKKLPSKVTTLSEKLAEDNLYQESSEASSDDETQQQTAAASRPLESSSNSSDSFSSDYDQQKATITQNKDDSLKANVNSGKERNSPSSPTRSSSNNDKFLNAASPPKQMVGSEKRPSMKSKSAISNRELASKFEKMKEEAGEPQASNKENKSLHSYEKYKEYKELMKLALKDNSDS